MHHLFFGGWGFIFEKDFTIKRVILTADNVKSHLMDEVTAVIMVSPELWLGCSSVMLCS